MPVRKNTHRPAPTKWVLRPKQFRPCFPSVFCMTTQSGTDEATATFRDAQQRVLDPCHGHELGSAATGRGDSRPIANYHAPGAAHLGGQQDGFGCPEAGRRAVQHMPYADLQVMSGGRAPWLHRAGRVAALSHEFLDTH